MDAFSLELPNEEEIREEVVKETAPSDETKGQINDLVVKNADKILSVNLDEQESRRACVAAVESFGVEAIKRARARMQYFKNACISSQELAERPAKYRKVLKI